jgi:hypothetical protein
MLAMAVAFYFGLPVYVHWDAVYDVLKHQNTPAWVQAFGSLLAVGVVLFVWRLDRGREERDAINMSKAYAQSLIGALDGLISAGKAANEEAVLLAAKLTDEAGSIGRGLPLHQLPRAQQKMMVELRALTVMVAASIDRFFRAHPRPFDVLVADVDDLARKALGSMQEGGIVRVTRIDSNE